MQLPAAATSYLAAGLAVLPARLPDKRPAIGSWKTYQSRLPTAVEVAAWFANPHDGCCLICGAVSGNLELLDFDCAGEAFAAWSELVAAEAPGLLDRLVVETSPSGGWHVVYRCAVAVEGNLKLAQRREDVDGPVEVQRFGKAVKPRKDKAGRWHLLLTLIETRGEGGLFLCAPTPGYTLVQGDFTALPVITPEEREVLLRCARALNQAVPEPVDAPSQVATGLRPGDDFARRADLPVLLTQHGWSLVRDGDNQHWCRPGKTGSTSATLRDGVFYVFSSNADPFEPGRAYSPFAVYALLEHRGDFQAAAMELRRLGFGDPPPDDGGDVDLSGLLTVAAPVPSEPDLPDPGPIPMDLLRVPGFVGAVMDHCLATAPYPNQAMAFCGALALQAFLAGRKVREPGGLRTNLYLLGLAHSSSGKDWPRKLNTQILHHAGLSACLGDKFASGEGLQDALLATPAMLFQTDEIDGLLQSINKAQDARHEGILGALLTFYTSADSVVPMRRKAGQQAPGVIDQPCLVIFGTAIPNHYYEALSRRMLTNGFFARTIVVEGGKRGEGQDAGPVDPPEHILTVAKYWADYRPSQGNLFTEHPVPALVPMTGDAAAILSDCRKEADAAYARCEGRNDSVGTTVWGRVNEQARRLALIHAVSANHQDPMIDAAAATWATRFVLHQTKRMLFMAGGHVAENPFHADCLRCIEKLREAPERTLEHSVLLKRMRMKIKDLQEVIETLVQQDEIEVQTTSTSGRPNRRYRLTACRSNEANFFPTQPLLSHVEGSLQPPLQGEKEGGYGERSGKEDGKEVCVVSPEETND